MSDVLHWISLLLLVPLVLAGCRRDDSESAPHSHSTRIQPRSEAASPVPRPPATKAEGTFPVSPQKVTESDAAEEESGQVGRLKWGYIDKSGKLVIDLQFDHAAPFHEGLALVTVGDLCGFINRTGEMVIQPQFGDQTREFSEGRAMVQTARGKCGFIGSRGEWVIEPRFDWAQSFQEGIAQVRVDEKHGFIDEQGNYLVEPQYEFAGNFNGGYTYVSRDGDKWWFIDRTGEIRFGSYEHADDFSDGVARVQIDGTDVLLTSTGELVRVPHVTWLSAYCHEDRIEFSRDGRGFLDRQGREVIRPMYEDTSSFREGLAAVKLDGKWGFIDTQGRIVIEPQFEKATSFADGWARVVLDGEQCYIDRTGAVVLRPKYPVFWAFSEGLTPVCVKK